MEDYGPGPVPCIVIFVALFLVIACIVVVLLVIKKWSPEYLLLLETARLYVMTAV